MTWYVCMCPLLILHYALVQDVDTECSEVADALQDMAADSNR